MARRTVTIALLVLGVVVLAVVVARVIDEAGGDDGDATSAPLTVSLSRATPAEAPFGGLTEVRAAIGDGRCLRLAVADSQSERVAGLRGNTADLGPYDGMLFVFAMPTGSAFTMSGVADPLDIAFFDVRGERTSTRAMNPCPEKAENECPIYASDRPFVYAVETPKGQLPSGAITACSAS